MLAWGCFQQKLRANSGFGSNPPSAAAARSQRLFFTTSGSALPFVQRTHFRVPLTTAIALAGVQAALKQPSRFVNRFFLPMGAATNRLDWSAPEELLRHCSRNLRQVQNACDSYARTGFSWKLSWHSRMNAVVLQHPTLPSEIRGYRQSKNIAMSDLEGAAAK